MPLATYGHVFMDTEKTSGIFFEFNEMWLNDDDEPLEFVFSIRTALSRGKMETLFPGKVLQLKERTLIN